MGKHSVWFDTGRSVPKHFEHWVASAQSWCAAWIEFAPSILCTKRVWYRQALLCAVLSQALSLVCYEAWAAEVYKWRLPDGTIEYSDVPSDPKAKRVDLPEIQIYSPPRREIRGDENPLQSLPGAAEPPKKFYESVRIVLPADGATFRDQGGSVSVQASVSPSLGPGDQLEILLDGQVVANGPSALLTVERGTHVVKAVVRSRVGAVLVESAPVSFHMHRTTARR